MSVSIYDELVALAPAGVTADEIVIGPFITAVRAGERVGLSTTLRPPRHEHKSQVTRPGELAGRPLAEIAALVASKLPLEAALGMAAINAGLPRAGLRLEELNGADLVRELAEGLNLVVVGHFSFIDQVAPVTQSTAILELDPQQGDLPSSAADRAIPNADVVVITGSAFANHTIERLLELAAGKTVVVLGPTTPLSPVLFRHGVRAAAGSDVFDPDLTLRQAREGAVFRQLTGVRKVMLVK